MGQSEITSIDAPGSTKPVRVLLAYASKCGTCAEIAEEVGRVLGESGASVDVTAARKAKAVGSYDAYVLGTAIRMGKPLGEMRKFVKKHQRLLEKRPTAVFSVGLAPREGTEEGLEEAAKYIAPVAEQVGADDVATFAGAIFADRLPFPFSKAAKDPEGALAEGDYRDWDLIRSWASAVAPHLTA